MQLGVAESFERCRLHGPMTGFAELGDGLPIAPDGFARLPDTPSALIGRSPWP